MKKTIIALLLIVGSVSLISQAAPQTAAPSKNPLVDKTYKLANENQLDQAKATFSKIYADEKSRTHEVYILGGWLHKKMKDPKAALQFYSQSLAVAKTDQEKALSYKRMAYASDDLREQKKAVEYFNQALRLSPGDTEMMADLVNVAVDAKIYDQAIQTGEKLLTIKDSPQVKLHLSDAYAGKAEQEMAGPLNPEKIKSARSLATQCLKWNAKNASCHQLIARADQSAAPAPKASSKPQSATPTKSKTK